MTPKTPITPEQERAFDSLIRWMNLHRGDLMRWDCIREARRLLDEHAWNYEAAKEAAKESE